MPESTIHLVLTASILVAGPVVFALLFFVSAPYGRHVRTGWGPTIPSRVGWVLMESPAVLLFAAVFLAGDHRWQAVPLLLAAVWMLHYVHRTFVYPWRMRMTGKRMPVLVAVLSFTFQTINAYVNARWISHLGDYSGWLSSPLLWTGIGVFVVGLVMNRHADHVLAALRRPGDTGYAIPHGGMYRFVSCPNYLGEILEWIGWAIATASLAGTAFAVFTIANLLPRAIAHHRWYRATFPAYPPERKALVPWVL